MAVLTLTAKLDPGPTVRGANELWPSIMHLGISRQRNSAYKTSRENITAHGLSSPDPSLSPTHLSIRRGHATTTHYTHNQVSLMVSCNITPLPCGLRWASLWGRPQRWHAKGACATPKEKKRKEKKAQQHGIQVIKWKVTTNTSNIGVTMKCGLDGHSFKPQGHWKWRQSINYIRFTISLPL